MCGICGVVSPDGSQQAELVKMRETLRHRGPDDVGLYQDAEFGVALGHTRLSIIDLTPAGRQPLASNDGCIQVVVNGEFYGYRDVRERLIAAGHRFCSESDSEIAVHLYEDYGADFVKQLRGMFGLALWDAHAGCLYLARDPIGKKTVYYAHVGRRFAFASEIKALRTLEWVSNEFDMRALDDYFAAGYTVGERSIFRHIRRLPPGHCLRFDVRSGGLELSRFWALPDAVDSVITEDEALHRLEELLSDSVERRLVSDVPVGIFLSGGVDSSVVATMAAKASPEPVRTFSVGFTERAYSELDYSRLVAEHIGSDHTEILVELDALSHLDDLVCQYDEPYADSSALPTFLISKATRSSVTVALSGDGGDELFAGYNWYDWVLSGARIRGVPLVGDGVLPALGRMLPPGMRGKHYLSRLSLDPARQYVERTFLFDEPSRRSLLLFDPSRGCGSRSIDAQAIDYLSTEKPLLDAMQRWDFSHYLPDDILTKVDRASMAVALEVRCPLLDVALCEFAFSLPMGLRMRGGVKKYLLKRLARRILPTELPLERKQGFSIPLSQWMRGELGDLLEARVLHGRLLDDFVRPSEALRLLQEHRGGCHDHGSRLWVLLMFGIWLDAEA